MFFTQFDGIISNFQYFVKYNKIVLFIKLNQSNHQFVSLDIDNNNNIYID